MDIVVEAKKEYTKKLNCVLLPHFMKFYNNISSLQTDKHEELRKVPVWNSTLVNSFVDEIKKDCSWLEELVTAVFISHVKILSSVKINDSKQTIKLKVPECCLFIHSVFCNCTEYVYYNLDMLPIPKENMIPIIDHSIENTISELLPFESILAMYIREQEEAEEAEKDEDEEEEDEDETGAEEDETENHETENHETENDETGSNGQTETDMDNVDVNTEECEDYSDLAAPTKTVNFGNHAQTSTPAQPQGIKKKTEEEEEFF